MINLASEKLIYRPVKEIFDFTSTPANDFQWQYGTLMSAQITDGAARVGAFFRSMGHFMGRRTESTFEITHFEPGKRFGFKSLSGPIQSQTFYTFEQTNGATKMTVCTQGSLLESSQAHEGVLEKLMKKQLKENLEMLKEILESK